MSELFDTIDKRAQEQAERERAAYDHHLAEVRKAAQTKRRKASAGMILRVLVTVAICVAMSLAGKHELIDRAVIRGIYVALAAWVSFWAGAWIQFMWCKGGLLQ